MPCTDGRTNPRLWERAKKKALSEACRSGTRRCGKWDARIAQRAGKLYRDLGGGYCGPRTKDQRSLSRWTKEDWRTVSGEKACRKKGRRIVCDRYLPAKAWTKLTPAQAAATRRVKKAAATQFVPNAPAAKKAGQIARSGRRR